MRAVLCPHIYSTDLNDLWCLAIFGECRLMAWLISRKRLSSPLIKKDFRAYHPLLARGDYTAVTMNHQKWPRANFSGVFSSKEVNVYPTTRAYGSSESGELHFSNHVTKCDDDLTSFTSGGNSADSSDVDSRHHTCLYSCQCTPAPLTRPEKGDPHARHHGPHNRTHAPCPHAYPQFRWRAAQTAGVIGTKH